MPSQTTKIPIVKLSKLIKEEISESVYPMNQCIEEQFKRYKNKQKSSHICEQIRKKYEIVIENKFNKILKEFDPDPSAAVVSKPGEGTVTDIYRKAIAALNLWIGVNYIPSQKVWAGRNNKKAFEHYVYELYGDSPLAVSVFKRASRIPISEIPAYYGQVEMGNRDKQDMKMKNKEKRV